MSVREVSVEDLAAVVREGRDLVVDVREPDEYAAGHVPGARNVPLAEIPAQLDVLRTSGPVYVVCATGGRSMYACEWLHDRGLTSAVNVAGGTKLWALLGNALESGAPDA